MSSLAIKKLYELKGWGHTLMQSLRGPANDTKYMAAFRRKPSAQYIFNTELDKV
jgi:hypothetical protein